MRIKKALICLGLAALMGVLFFFGIQLYMLHFSQPYYVTTDGAPKSDAILVLGSLVYANGNPSPVLSHRLDNAYELYINGAAEKIIVSGDHGRDNYDEVNAMRDYLCALGVPKEDVFMDHAGFNTYDSFFRAKEIFLVESVVISTQEFHMPRSLYIARNLGIDAYGAPCPDSTTHNVAYNNVRESLARVKAYFDVSIVRRPAKYSGPVIPISGDGRVTEG